MSYSIAPFTGCVVIYPCRDTNELNLKWVPYIYTGTNEWTVMGLARLLTIIKCDMEKYRRTQKNKTVCILDAMKLLIQCNGLSSSSSLLCNTNHIGVDSLDARGKWNMSLANCLPPTSCCLACWNVLMHNVVGLRGERGCFWRITLSVIIKQIYVNDDNRMIFVPCTNHNIYSTDIDLYRIRLYEKYRISGRRYIPWVFSTDMYYLKYFINHFKVSYRHLIRINDTSPHIPKVGYVVHVELIREAEGITFIS